MTLEWYWQGGLPKQFRPDSAFSGLPGKLFDTEIEVLECAISVTQMKIKELKEEEALLTNRLMEVKRQEPITNIELSALAEMVLNRVHESFAEKCDCPLHLLSKEERAAKIDAAIEETIEQMRQQ